MMLTEYKSKAILTSVGINVPAGFTLTDPSETHKILSYPVAVKAQVASGGRGLAGGVVKAQSETQAKEAIARIMALKFDDSHPECVLIEPWLSIEREVYLSVTIDGLADGYSILYSPNGGVAVEQGVAPTRYPVGLTRAFRAHIFRAILLEVEPDIQLRERVISMAERLLQLASSQDLMTIEINPLVRLSDGSLIAADAKIVVDEAARFRNQLIDQAMTWHEARQSAMLSEASKQRLMLVWLGGEIGLISGGAGMTMAAMDMIADAGSSAACFLDCSANPTPAGYDTAFQLLDQEPQVKVILVAIFGGGTHMDRVARVMVQLIAKRTSVKPVVFRLNGTHGNEVAPIFKAAGLDNFFILEDAVAAAVSAAKGI